MLCPLCRQRKAKRLCPALGQQICAVCCGSKRLVEIRCPADCGYLLSARAHPPAKVQRQQERDVRFFTPLIHNLSESQYRLFLVLQSVVKRYRPTAIPAVNDDDVAEAAATLAATFETASRGIVYEHQATSLTAQRLAMELKSLLDDVAASTRLSLARDAAPVLRRIEQGARQARKMLDGGPSTYLDLVDRVLQPSVGTSESGSPTAEASESDSTKLIIPGT